MAKLSLVFSGRLLIWVLALALVGLGVGLLPAHAAPLAGSIGDFVWRDLDQDGLQDPLEPGIDGVLVELLNSSGAVLTTTTTAGGGLYSFDGLAAGTYQVRIAASNFQVGGPLYQFGLTSGAFFGPNPFTVVLAADQVFTLADFGYARAAAQIIKTVSTTGVCPGANTATVPPGASLTYCYQITNQGDTYLANLQVTDDVLGAVCTVPGPLAPGASETCRKDATASQDVCNIGSLLAEATDSKPNVLPDFDPVRATSNQVCIDVLPNINVTKTANPTSVPEPGANVQFTVRVDNLSLEPLTLTTLVDSVFGNLNGQGTCSVPRNLPVGGFYQCTFTAFVGGNAGDSETNVVTGTARDDDGNTVNDSDDATVVITDVLPTINVIKTANPTTIPEPGGTVQFTVRVENTSPEPVTLTALVDDVHGNLNGQGSCSVPRSLGVGAFYQCSFSASVFGNPGYVETDTVTATARDDDGNTVQASDPATVTITDVLPTILVNKTANPTTVLEPGGNVQFTVRVDNTSIEPLTLTALVDNIHGNLNGQGTCSVPRTLAVGGFYQCSFTAFVGGNAGSSETDTVTASARDDDGNTVQATDPATVNILGRLPDISVLKDNDANGDGVFSDTEQAPSDGAVVTFRVTISNNSPEAAIVTSISDSVHPSPLTSASRTPSCQSLIGANLPGNGTLVCYFDGVINVGGSQSETNVITVAARDDEGNTDTATDTSTVTVGLTSVGDFVWEDRNGNGLQDSGEPGVPGVVVNLYTSDGTSAGTQTTNANGFYLFTGLVPRGYFIEFIRPNGYVFTLKDVNGNTNDTRDSDADPVTGRTDVFALTSGQADLTRDAGLYRPAALGDYVWYDASNDGLQDVGEPGLGNITLRLYRDNGNGVCEPGAADGAAVASQVTDSDGGYIFTGLQPGGYCVDVVNATVPAGLVLTSGPQSRPDPSPVVVIASGDVYRDVDFGYVDQTAPGNAIIGDTVWYDGDGDGIRDPGEPGVPGVIVCATPSGGGAPLCDVTDANGVYLIEVPAGTYVVQPTNPPSGFTPTTPTAQTVTVTPGQQYLDADFGYDSPTLGVISGTVWDDSADKDGILDPGEPRFPGVSVSLIVDQNNNGVLDPGEPIFATDTTDQNGNFSFEGVPPGNYLVVVTDTQNVLDDYAPSPVTFPPGVTTDDRNRAQPYPVTLPAGGSDATADFGYVKDGTSGSLGIIGNQVWYERDRDGLYEPDLGDIGVAGVTVDLYRDSGGGNFVFVATTTTGASGDYVFTSLPAGTYRVQVSDDFGILANFIGTVPGPNPGQDNNNQVQPYLVGLPSDGVNMTADFGYTQLASVGDYVWEDRNVDGIQNDGNAGINGVEVRLWQVGGVAPLRTTTTANDANNRPGYYLFDGLTPGNYFVQFVLPAGYQFTLRGPTGVKDLLDSDPDPVTGRTENFSLAPNEMDMSWDAGLYRPNTIGDYAWVDTNGNKVPDPGESPLDGVIIQVTNSQGAVVAVVTTGPVGGFPNGTYLVTNLPPGTYTATVVSSPVGYLLSGPAQRTSVPLVSGQSDLTLDFPFVSTTGVSVQSLKAARSAQGTVVSWTTLFESGVDGFYVWRSASPTGPFQRISDLIASRAAGQGGARYSYLDRSVTPGTAYWYRIEAAPLGELFGPVSDYAGRTQRQVFLPAVVK